MTTTDTPRTADPYQKRFYQDDKGNIADEYDNRWTAPLRGCVTNGFKRVGGV